ncbi:MAG: ribbon-helix-helix domain-containing protein [Terriglobales bacterium]
MKIPSVERVTVSLPGELVQGIDRKERNRSKFVAEAVRRELDRRRREELRRSLRNPHPEAAGLADEGLEAWSRTLPDEAAESLLDRRAGKAVRWIPGKGWVEGRA